MYRILAGLALTTALLCSGSAMAAEKCYEAVLVPASMSCSTSNSKSADFTNGCKPVDAHYEQKEIECQVGRWVNIIAETKIGTYGDHVTQAQACAAYGLKSYNINGKTCASGERTPTQGTGWESINYKYGKKGGGNGGDGGDKLQPFSSSAFTTNHGDGPAGMVHGTMCYDNDMGTKNNTKQDAAVAVYCK